MEEGGLYNTKCEAEKKDGNSPARHRQDNIVPHDVHAYSSSTLARSRKWQRYSPLDLKIPMRRILERKGREGGEEGGKTGGRAPPWRLGLGKELGSMEHGACASRRGRGAIGRTGNERRGPRGADVWMTRRTGSCRCGLGQ